MNRTVWIALVMLPLFAGCATTERVPVAVPSPPLPPAPAALTSPASTGPSLSVRMENSLQKFEASLTKAQRQP